MTWLYDGRKICYADRERPFTGKWRYGIMEKTFVIRKLIPELSADYFDFFDHLAFSDNSPMQPCYCCNFNLMEDEQNRLMEEYEKNGLEAYRVELRKAAERLVADNSLQGYLIYDGEKAVGWCNANDKSNYTAYGFNESIRGSRNVGPGYVKAVLCFEIAPGYRGKGIASALLKRVCEDAKKEGFQFVEGYPRLLEEYDPYDYTGPIHLFEKAGFEETARQEGVAVMRKEL